MLYTAYELAYAAVAPARIAAGVGAKFWRSPFNPVAESWFGRSAAATRAADAPRRGGLDVHQRGGGLLG